MSIVIESADSSVSSVAATSPRLLGRLCALSGLLGVVIGIIMLAYPPVVPASQWSYPFPTSVQWVISLVLAVAHLMTLAGFLGVLAVDPHRRARAATLGIWAAVAGLAALAVCEVLSGAIGGQTNTSSAAAAVGGAYGVASLVTAAGSILAGIIVVRRGVWTGLGRWAMLASGVILIALVTPASIIGDTLFTNVALMLWSVTFVFLGQAVVSSAETSGRNARVRDGQA